MNTANERGALGKRFHDLPTTSDNPDLSWEAMARHILPPELPEEKPNNKKPFFWWWFVGAALLTIVFTVYWLSDVKGKTLEPAVVPAVATIAEAVNKDASTTVATEPLPAKVNESLTSTPKRNRETETGLQSVSPDRPAATTQNGLDSEETLSLSAELKEVAPVNETAQVDPIIEIDETTQFHETNQTEEAAQANEIAQETEAVQPSELIAAVTPLEILPLLEAGSEIEFYPTVPQQEEVISKKGALVLMGGVVSFQSGYEGNAPWLANEQNDLSGQLSARYEHALGANWFVSGGIDARQYRFRTAFENIDTDARIYQPGTVDTIFRNLTTGEDRVVTTDTVVGTQIRRFGNDNSVIELGVPLLIGRRWTLGKHDLSIAAGPRLGLMVNRNGRTLVENNTVSDLEDAPQFSKNLNFASRLELGYGFQLAPKIFLLGNFGVESALSDWAESAALKQRPTVLNGQLGLRFSLK